MEVEITTENFESYKNGELVDKFVGAASKDKLDEKFKTLL